MNNSDLVWLCFDEQSQADVYWDISINQVVFVITGLYLVWFTGDVNYQRFLPENSPSVGDNKQSPSDFKGLKIKKIK